MHLGYGFLSLAYMAFIYWLSSLSDPALQTGIPVGSLASNLLHVPLYAGLTFCVGQALAGPDTRRSRGLTVSAFVVAAGYAGLDEWHQSFVAGRTASVGDFLLDVVGIGAMLLFVGALGARRASTGICRPS